MSYLGEIPHPKPCIKCGKPTRELRWVEGHTASLCHTCSTKVENPTPELILKDHTEANIISLARFIQTEGVISWAHHDRTWHIVVAFGMAPIEPVQYTARLLDVTPVRNAKWSWVVTNHKALQLIELVKPHLMADKLEEAEYTLRITKRWKLRIPDTEYRPMYIGLVERTIRPVFLYEEYADFPIKYAKTVRKGEILPRPLRPRMFPVKYTTEGAPILWIEGLKRDPEEEEKNPSQRGNS